MITAVVTFLLRKMIPTNLIVSFVIEGIVVVGLYVALLMVLRSDNVELMKKSIATRMGR